MQALVKNIYGELKRKKEMKFNRWVQFRLKYLMKKPKLSLGNE